MRKLIINADDLGYSTDVDLQIEKGFQKGLVTSSTLMANAPGFLDGVRIAKKYNKVSIGVHLNLVEFSPLTNVEIFKKHRIVGDDGNFIDGAIFVRPINDELRQAVYEEWDAQINKIKNSGIEPSHLDSHQHTHTIQELQKVLIDIMSKHNIVKVRRKSVPSIRKMLFGNKYIKVVHDKSNAVQAPKRNVLYRRFHLFVIKFQNNKWNYVMSKQHKMADSFYAFRDFYMNKNLLNLGHNGSVIELMCHPGQKAFDQETEKLMKDSSWIPKGYELTNYTEL